MSNKKYRDIMTKKEMSRRSFLKWTGTGIGALALGSAVPPMARGAKPFEGVEVTVLTENPPFIARPIDLHAPAWEKKTGGKIKHVTFAFPELYERMMSSMTLGAAKFDIIVYAAIWLGDFHPHLAPLNQYVEDSRWKADLAWDDIMVAYRERITTWGKDIYGLTLDGDNFTMAYRKDAFENTDYQKRFENEYGYPLAPPKTWRQYADAAKFFTGWDWDGDGEKEYGAVITMRPERAAWFFCGRMAPYVSPPGQHGMYFDPDTMEPLIDGPGHVQALKDWMEMVKYGPEGMTEYDWGEHVTGFGLGKAALTYGWGDHGLFCENAEESRVKGKVGYGPMPGVKKVYDHKKGAWIDFPNVNTAPYLSWNGWIGGIPKNSKVKEAAFDFLVHLTKPENSIVSVTTQDSGFNPYRRSHFENLSQWVDFGFSEASAKSYLDAIKAVVADPNSQLDFQIPGTQRYFDALGTACSRALSGEASPEKALGDAAKEWRRIVEDIGRDKQQKDFKNWLGL
jgi:multiple sugar transport system substrate-binding protein